MVSGGVGVGVKWRLDALESFHHCLKTGFNSVLHLLQNLIRIEG